jgi:hypothetical protein
MQLIVARPASCFHQSKNFVNERRAWVLLSVLRKSLKVEEIGALAKGCSDLRHPYGYFVHMPCILISKSQNWNCRERIFVEPERKYGDVRLTPTNKVQDTTIVIQEHPICDTLPFTIHEENQGDSFAIQRIIFFCGTREFLKFVICKGSHVKQP